MKVLIVDDSAEALAVARARLTREGLDVVCAANGRDGLEAARLAAPDLVLLDVEMPGLSGFDVCRHLKSDVDLCMVPVIFLTASDATADKVKGLNLGAVDYVTKPFDAFELPARVAAALRTKRLQDLLIQYAQVDPLTELSNRRALMERLQREWARIHRHGGSLAFIMADIDHFKQVNDTHGHQVGDRVLCEVAKVIARECRAADCAARYGGEEFAVLVPDESAEGAAHLAERCRRRIEDLRVPVKAGEVRTTASFGIAELGDDHSEEVVIQQADAALYRAKQTGRNRCVTAISPAAAAAPSDAAAVAPDASRAGP